MVAGEMAGPLAIGSPETIFHWRHRSTAQTYQTYDSGRVEGFCDSRVASPFLAFLEASADDVSYRALLFWWMAVLRRCDGMEPLWFIATNSRRRPCSNAKPLHTGTCPDGSCRSPRMMTKRRSSTAENRTPGCSQEATSFRQPWLPGKNEARVRCGRGRSFTAALGSPGPPVSARSRSHPARSTTTIS